MTDGELRAVLNQRNTVIAKFLDRAEIWHCFVHTARGIEGLETGHTPHIHYISSSFGTKLTRELVLESIQKGKYDLPNMTHLNFHDE